MDKIFLFLMLIALMGCTQTDETSYVNDIYRYQGVWRDTTYANNDICIENLIVADHSISYELTNANTHIVWDKFMGSIELGNENKIRWNCVSSITNSILPPYYWNVIELSTYRMKLYSNLQGEHDYRRAYSSSLEEFEKKDTLEEILQFKKYLPLTKDGVANKFGSYNRLSNERGISYYISNPFFDKICFKPNYDNDSVYSYILTLRKENLNGNEWYNLEDLIENRYFKIRDINGIREFCDDESLVQSNSIFNLDRSSQQITVSPIKGYDYWPNGLQFIGRTLKDVKDELSAKYVYTYYKYPDSELVQYDYQTSHDGLCSIISICSGSDEIVSRSAIWLIGNYSEEQESLVLHLLRNKYCYDRYENNIYYFYSDKVVENSKYEVRYMPSRNVIMYFSII